MDPTSLFNWGALCCNCLIFLFLGLMFVLWMLSPRVEGRYVEHPQRTRVDRQPPRAGPVRSRPGPTKAPKQPQPAARQVAPAVAARPAAKETRPSSLAPVEPALDTSALSVALAEAQRAAEAIDDLQIAFPTIPQYDFEIQVPAAPEIAGALVSPAPAAGAATVGDQAAAKLEAGVRAAVQQVAERVERATPAAKPITQRVKVTAQQAPSPLSAPTLAQGMDLILQDLLRREAEPLRQALHVESTPEGGVKILVADRIYFSVAEMPEGRPKRLLQQAVKQWNELWQSQNQASGKR
jgi:hypothetical protein